MTLNLNNMNINNLMKFLGETLKKPILKDKSVNTTLTVSSLKPVTKAQALDLIYDAADERWADIRMPTLLTKVHFDGNEVAAGDDIR